MKAMTKFKEPMAAARLMPSGMDTTDDNILKMMKLMRFPVAATLKKDGIRAFVMENLVSRSLKPIPNYKIAEAATYLPQGFDMELFNPALQYHEIESIVMSRSHADWQKIEFHVIDWFDEELGYKERYDHAFNCGVVSTLPIVYEQPTVCNNVNELFNFFLQAEELQGEGICFRTPNSKYKQGRSTLKEQGLVKLCRLEIDEAEIIGFIEQMENGNPENRNGTGRMDRSTNAAKMYGKNTLGSLLVRNKSGQEFRIGTGTGLTDRLRQLIWDNQQSYKGRTIVYSCKPHGAKVLPRSPIMKGFRTDL
jgi:DNA ligase-1